MEPNGGADPVKGQVGGGVVVVVVVVVGLGLRIASGCDAEDAVQALSTRPAKPTATRAPEASDGRARRRRR
jgi:hypothetical protein